MTVDFLIPPSLAGDQGGKLRDIEKDFAAIIAPGLKLAFEDRRRVRIAGRTVFGEQATRDVWVCGPGAFVVLKALAFQGRGEPKDAYDLYYVVRNFGAGAPDVGASDVGAPGAGASDVGAPDVGAPGVGAPDVAGCLRPLLGDAEARRALQVLRDDFLDHDSVGPRRVAEFLRGAPDDDIQADVVGFVRALVVAVVGG